MSHQVSYQTRFDKDKEIYNHKRVHITHLGARSSSGAQPTRRQGTSGGGGTDGGDMLMLSKGDGASNLAGGKTEHDDIVGQLSAWKSAILLDA